MFLVDEKLYVMNTMNKKVVFKFPFLEDGVYDDSALSALKDKAVSKYDLIKFMKSMDVPSGTFVEFPEETDFLFGITYPRLEFLKKLPVARELGNKIEIYSTKNRANFVATDRYMLIHSTFKYEPLPVEKIGVNIELFKLMYKYMKLLGDFSDIKVYTASFGLTAESEFVKVWIQQDKKGLDKNWRNVVDTPLENYTVKLPIIKVKLLVNKARSGDMLIVDNTRLILRRKGIDLMEQQGYQNGTTFQLDAKKLAYLIKLLQWNRDIIVVPFDGARGSFKINGVYLYTKQEGLRG